MAVRSAVRRWGAPVAVALVVVLLAAAAAIFFHERRMSSAVEGFFSGEEQGRLLGKESFLATPSAENPSAGVQSRKAAAYLAEGFAFFFSANTPSDVQAAISGYYAFFSPTDSDLQCDFTNRGQSGQATCNALIDSITCTDRTTNIPANYIDPASQVNSIAVTEPVDSNDCRVSVFDSVYMFQKSSVLTHAFVYVAPGQPSDGVPVFLALPRGAFSTRLIMMLRPAYVRCGASRLYYVDYSVAGTDGMAYDSWDTDAGANAVLQIVPVMDATIDANKMPIAPIVNPPPSDPFVSNPNGSHQASPAAAARSISIPRSRKKASIVCYYLNYAGPNPAIPQGSATPVATAYLKASPNNAQVVTDDTGRQVLNASIGNALSPTMTVSVAGQAYSMPALDGSGGVAIVTACMDLVVASCSTPDRTSVRRFTLPNGVTLMPYVPPVGATGCESSPGLASKIGLYANSSTNAIPNMADVALRASCLHPVAFSVTEVTRPPSDTLLPDSPLLPGQSLVSSSGAFKAVFQFDSNFVIYNTQTGLPVWATSTASKAGGSTAKPYRLSIGRTDGILRAFDDTMRSNPSAKPFWVSSSVAAPADQAPYFAQLTDAGNLVVKGALGAAPVWASGAGSYGVASLATCAAASAMYAAVNAAALAQTGGGVAMSPWSHYIQIGQLEGLVWPGPPGPC